MRRQRQEEWEKTRSKGKGKKKKDKGRFDREGTCSRIGSAYAADYELKKNDKQKTDIIAKDYELKKNDKQQTDIIAMGQHKGKQGQRREQRGVRKDGE